MPDIRVVVYTGSVDDGWEIPTPPLRVLTDPVAIRVYLQTLQADRIVPRAQGFEHGTNYVIHL